MSRASSIASLTLTSTYRHTCHHYRFIHSISSSNTHRTSKLHTIQRHEALVTPIDCRHYNTTAHRYSIFNNSGNDNDKIDITSVAEAHQEASKYDLWLDVREQHEWDAGHVDTELHNVKHIPLRYILDIDDHTFVHDELEDDTGERSFNIIVYCARGTRSDAAARILKSKGYKVTNMLGGWMDWSEIAKQQHK